MSSKPQLLCWLMCDGVHIDPSTGKHTLLGVFANLAMRQFPGTHPQMIWFLVLSDIHHGKHTMRISMHLDFGEPKTIVEREFEVQSPLQRIHLINQVRNLKFERPGDYSLTIEVDDDPILVSSLPVMGPPQPPPDQDQGGSPGFTPPPPPNWKG
jgi:hypothetical protein